VSHKPSGRLPLPSARPAVTLATLKWAATLHQFICLANRGTIGVNSLPTNVTRQHRGCNMNPGPTAPESSTLTTRLPSYPGKSGKSGGGNKRSCTHAVLLYRDVGQMYEHVVQFGNACVVLHRAESTEAQTISARTPCSIKKGDIILVVISP